MASIEHNGKTNHHAEVVTVVLGQMPAQSMGIERTLSCLISRGNAPCPILLFSRNNFFKLPINFMSFPIFIPLSKKIFSDKLAIYLACTQDPYHDGYWHPPVIQLGVAQLAGPCDWLPSKMVG